MSKIEDVKKDLLDARKSGNSLQKNLLSTFIGEYDNQAKGGADGDELVHAIARKMIKSAETIGTDEAKQEIKILQGYLPVLATKQQVLDFLKDKDFLEQYNYNADEIVCKSPSIEAGKLFFGFFVDQW